MTVLHFRVLAAVSALAL